MKKILMLVLLSMVSYFLLTCSKEDDSIAGETPTLKVEASAREIRIGDRVHFTITANNVTVEDARLFIGERQITNPYQFKEAGIHNVIAKKSGYKQSDAIAIKVLADDSKPISLTVDKNSVYVGDTVTFTVMSGSIVLEDVTIKDQNDKRVEGMKWTANQAGKFRFVATKEGYKVSKTVEVEVKERPKGEPNTIYINNKVYKIDVNKTFLYAETIVGDDGKEHVRLYKTTTSEGEVITFATYFIDVVSEDFVVENNTVVSGAIARIWKIIIQENNPVNAIYPGENKMLELDLQGLIVSSDQQETMNTNDIKKFDVVLHQFVDPNGYASLNVTNSFAGVVYDGRVQSMMSYNTKDVKSDLSLKLKDNRKSFEFSKDYFKTLRFQKEYKKVESRNLLSK